MTPVDQGPWLTPEAGWTSARALARRLGTAWEPTVGGGSHRPAAYLRPDGGLGRVVVFPNDRAVVLDPAGPKRRKVPGYVAVIREDLEFQGTSSLSAGYGLTPASAVRALNDNLARILALCGVAACAAVALAEDDTTPEDAERAALAWVDARDAAACDLPGCAQGKDHKGPHLTASGGLWPFEGSGGDNG